MVVNTVTEASQIARDKLIEMNGALRVVMFQVESANLLDYDQNEDKPTWKVRCSYYTDVSGTNRVTKELFIDQETGEVIEFNGSPE